MSIPSSMRTRRAKFVPPTSSPWMVSRPRLVELLDDALLFPVTLVSAAAGSGKTTLLAEWVRALDLPWGWLTVDQADASFELFLTNLISAIQAAAPGVGESTLSQMKLNADLDALIAELDEDLLLLDRNLVVVLDDAHLIADLRSVEFLSLLLQHPSPRLHLVVGARRDPPLPLGRLRSHGQLVEVRSADLAFTADETRTLLEHAGVSGALAETLEQKNEGWVAGIHLSALAMRSKRGGGADSSLVQAGVNDLIVHDILAFQAEPLQQLLLVSALPDRFTSELCIALLDQPGETSDVWPLLQELAAEGLLLFSLGGEPEWFRYHQIFREVLLRELFQRLSPLEMAALQARASAWFEQAGMIPEAISHALSAGQLANATAIVERQAQLTMAEDRWPELASWLEQLPPDIVRDRTELTVAQAWVFQSRGQYAEMFTAVDRARVLVEREAGTREPGWRAALLADLDTLICMSQPAKGDPQRFVAVGEAALTDARDRFASSFGVYHLGFGLIYQQNNPALERRMQQIIAEDRGSTNVFARQREIWARILLGFVYFNSGETARAIAAVEEVLGQATVYEIPRFAAMTRYVLGWIAYEGNRVEDAIAFYERVVHERATGIIVLINSILGLAGALEVSGRSDEAEQVFQRLAERYESATPRTYGLSLVRAYAAERSLVRGDHAAVASWLRGMSDWSSGYDANSNQYTIVVRIQSLIALDRLDDAELALQEMEVMAAQAPILSFRLRLLALRSLLSYAMGARQRAIDELCVAFQTAKSSGFIRGILDLGYGSQPFRELLAALPADELPLTRREIDQCYQPGERESAFERVPTAPATVTASSFEAPYEQLTEREQDVADGLARRLSYKEIAYELNISPLTVKSHSTRIYSKLGVTSRRQMIRMLERQGS